MQIWIVSIVLLLVLFFLVSEKLPVDVLAIGIMVVLVLSGILTPKEAVAGFSNTAVITVGAMFLVSKGMVRTGAVEYLGRKVIRIAQANLNLASLLILLTIAVASAFINNTPVVILFIPVVMAMCCKFDLSPSQFLIPVSYASILAGTCTLIGTSTNIIISDLSAIHGYGEFSMFELASLGLPIAVIGILFLVVAAPKVMPSMHSPICQIRDDAGRKYLAEIHISSKSKLVGYDPSVYFEGKYPSIEVIELIRESHIYQPSRDDLVLQSEDLLLIKGEVNDLVEIIHHEDVDLPRSEKGLSFGVGKEEPIVVELIIAPHSPMLGQRLSETELVRHDDINIIAVKRHNLHFTERQVHDVVLKTGDILLVWCDSNKLDIIRSGQGYIIIEDIFEEIIHKRKAWYSVIIFSAMVLSATLGLASIMICALTATFLMILFGCLQMRDAYKSLQGDVLLLIVGTIALGAAMEKTGASQFYAMNFLRALEGYSPQVVLAGMILLTSISTQLLSNNATAVLLFPIAVSTAIGLGVSPKPFIIAVCFGASACFASPIGYQTNLLVYGPGGYRFSDYFKLGIPLNVLVMVAGTYGIPFFWPL